MPLFAASPPASPEPPPDLPREPAPPSRPRAALKQEEAIDREASAQAALAFVARALGVEVGRERLRRALREATGEGQPWLIEAGAAVGLAVRLVRRPLAAVVREAHEQGPVLAESPGGWVALWGAEGGKACVVSFAPAEQTAQISVGELARLVGVDPDEEAGWLLATAALPSKECGARGTSIPRLCVACGRSCGLIGATSGWCCSTRRRSGCSRSRCRWRCRRS